jgi:hypothetical protein
MHTGRHVDFGLPSGQDDAHHTGAITVGLLCSYGGGGKCKEAAWSESPDGFCLLHAPNNGKDTTSARLVWQAARKKRSEPTADFTGWHFPADEEGFLGGTFLGPTHFSKTTFDAPARFLNVTFNDTVCFDDTIFAGEARFGHVRFLKEATFARCLFRDSAAFGAAVFEGAALFNNAGFRKSCSFGGVAFNSTSEFKEVSFRGPATFEAATFKDDASFEGTAYKSSVNFMRARFERYVSFEGTVFNGPPLFEGILLTLGKNAALGLDHSIRQLLP